MFVLLLINSKADFISAFNTQAQDVFGASGNAYENTLSAAAVDAPPPSELGAAKGLFLLIPFILFFNLWSNWGATLYGEVRGASDFRNNIRAMGGALLATSALAGIMFILFSKTFGWDFYNAANNAYWGQPALYNYVENPPVTYWPYPGLLAAFLMDGAVWQFILVGLLSLWFFGWVGTVFLSSTRVVFATAFDRILPEGVAKVSRNGVPWVALVLMLLPSIPIAYLYAYNAEFYNWTLAATEVIAITFAGSAIAAAILPWRRPDIYNASPIARYRVLGLPLITVAALAFLVILGFAIYEWVTNATYGLNIDLSDPAKNGFLYMLALYALALVIYVGSRLLRKQQGIDMSMVQKEIPAE
jgi:APA family basic amino acid/polyamine antiporter